jgi:hypothetical protein
LFGPDQHDLSRPLPIRDLHLARRVADTDSFRTKPNGLPPYFGGEPGNGLGLVFPNAAPMIERAAEVTVPCGWPARR